jgi:hypothetical protein
MASDEDSCHSEGHIVELDDGSTWRIFPGGMDVTLNWRPDTQLKLIHIDDRQDQLARPKQFRQHDNRRVRVLSVSESWPSVLNDG